MTTPLTSTNVSMTDTDKHDMLEQVLVLKTHQKGRIRKLLMPLVCATPCKVTSFDTNCRVYICQLRTGS